MRTYIHTMSKRTVEWEGTKRKYSTSSSIDKSGSLIQIPNDACMIYQFNKKMLILINIQYKECKMVSKIIYNDIRHKYLR